MANRSLNAVLPHLRRLLTGGADDPADPQLLERFLHSRDEGAFAALVRRHGPMVLSVCRRLLSDPHDAEDAFQATFLVLVRKAASLSRPERLGNWLYGVAYRTALKARSLNARRRSEQPLADVPAADGVADLVWRELRPILDDEVNRLPEKYRVPVVLCYLEGISKREAARRLGWPDGTLSSRLHKAREILRGRLTRRGLALSAGVVALALTQGAAPAAVPVSLAAAASLVAAGRAPLVPATVAALAEGVMRIMWWNKLKVPAILLAAILLAAGLGRIILPAPAAPPSEVKAPPAAPPPGDAPKKEATEPRILRLDKGVKEVVWSPDGKRMASRATRFEKRDGGAEDDLDWFSTVKVWDAVNGEEIVSLGEVKNSGLFAIGFADNVTLTLSFRRRIQDGDKVELWNARRGELKKTIEMDYGRAPLRFAFDPTGRTMAILYAGDKDRDKKTDDLNGGLRLFDLDKGEAIRSLRGHKHMAISLAYSPDGKLIATGGYSSDGDVRLWSVETGKEVRRIVTGVIVPAVAFSPDGKMLASGQGNGCIVLWDAATGKEVRTLKEAADSTLALTFSPDGRLLAAAGPVEWDKKRTNEVRIWSVASGQLLRTWPDTTTSIAFTPDGKRLAILGTDGAVRLWELTGLKEAADPKADYGFGRLIDQIIQQKKSDDQAAETLYVAALGRFPEEGQRKMMTDHLTKAEDRREAMVDIVWALVNSKEYMTRLDILKSNDPRKLLEKK